MRSAGNFHPDWGYLAPAPSFMRTARTVLVATAIGATAGAAVMISLVQHPATDAANEPIAAHALVTSVPVVAEAPIPVDERAVAQAPAQPAAAITPKPAVPQMQAAAPVSASKPNAITSPPSQAPENVATLAGPPSSAIATRAEAEAQPAAAPDETVAEPQTPPNQTKKQRTAGYDPAHRTQPAGKKWKPRPFDPLFRLFSSSGGPRSSF
jgi:hypothetical protein